MLQAKATVPAVPASWGTAKRFRYQAQDCSLTLCQAADEYLEGHPRVPHADTLSAKGTALFCSHVILDLSATRCWPTSGQSSPVTSACADTFATSARRPRRRSSFVQLAMARQCSGQSGPSRRSARHGCKVGACPGNSRGSRQTLSGYDR